MADRPYTEIEHTADWALEVHGATEAALFEHAASGMLERMGAVAAPGPSEELSYSNSAADRESLLVAWLEEILVRMELAPVTFTNPRVRLSDSHHLEATLRQHPRQAWRMAIKAVTFHNLRIESGPSGWRTTIVFDV